MNITDRFRASVNIDKTVFVVATREGSNTPIAWKAKSEQAAQNKLDSEYEKCLVKLVGLSSAEAFLKDKNNGLSERANQALKIQVDNEMEVLPDW